MRTRSLRVGCREQVDPPPGRVDAPDTDLYGIPQPDHAAVPRADEHRPRLVQLPPVAAHPPHREHPLEASVLAEGDERARPDQPDDLAGEHLLAAAATLEQPPLEQEAARD